jgi:hypothetical protein
VASTRQPYAYVHDNPLNATDPMGLYDYTFSENLGNFGAGGDVTAMDLLTDNPNGAFPFQVQGDNGNNHIVMGGHYCLHTNVILPLGCDNVHVSQMNATSFTFTAEAGHIEGEGGTITFSTHLDSNCNLTLTQHAHGPDFGWWGGFGLVNDTRKSKARELWATQGRRLAAEMKADGGKDPYSW